ncbi:MAG: hypothetical protein ACXVXC_05900, partial [Nocardioidaceae bacterium]
STCSRRAPKTIVGRAHSATACNGATLSGIGRDAAAVDVHDHLSAYTGKTVRVKFLGVEDSSAATSFLVDDTSLTTS